MPKKMPRRLVALSASAVAAVYFAGLLSTATAADTLSGSTVSAAGVATSTPTVVVGATATPIPVPTSTSTPASTSTGASKTGYADGTYSGTGSGRFGSVTVSVTTSGGAIGNVQITKVSTTFPVSQIASLPAQVVQTQSTNVNAVSGATASSQAFKQAMQQALAVALAANKTAATA
jgi:uncharacterized protein with FMN-binding domain